MEMQRVTLDFIVAIIHYNTYTGCLLAESGKIFSAHYRTRTCTETSFLHKCWIHSFNAPTRNSSVASFIFVVASYMYTFYVLI